MSGSSLRARLRYEFDKSMAKGPIALIGWLALVSLGIILLAGIVVAVVGIAPEGGKPLGFVEGTWESLMRTLDSGTMGGDEGWSFRIVMLFVTLAGIFVVSALIGVLSTGLDSKLDELRKGRSIVMEADHTVIFNWSPSIFDVISELIIANESRKRPRIVIMSDRDKVEMEDEIKSKIPDTKNTRIICRSGDPTDLYDIGIVNPQASRSIIILSPEGGDDVDSRVIKTILALVNDPARREAPYRIAAELREEGNADIARVVGGKEVQLVLADDLISRIVVQSCRQAGLSAVYTELLDFDGCEIYTLEQPELTGKRFDEAMLAYDTSSLIGICHPDGRVSLNPPMDTVIADGMRVVVIAEDDDAIQLMETKAEFAEVMVAPVPEPRVPERTLLLGWNRRGPMIALELSRYVMPGSILTVAADLPELGDLVAGLKLANSNMTIEYVVTDTGKAAEVNALDPASYDNVLVLGYSDHMEAQSADTRTLVTLLHLRGISRSGGKRVKVVSEMVDVRNRELARVTGADDFVVSNKLVSLMLAQASENEYLEAIFQDLLDEEGSEIVLRPIEDYVPLGVELTFHAVAHAAALRSEVAMGHYLPAVGSQDDRGLGGIIVNPTKSDKVTYAAGDRVILLAAG